MRETKNKNYELYNKRLLAWQMGKLGWTPADTASKADISELSVNRGLVGTLGTLATLRKLTDALGVKWEFITRIDLSESQFHRAVLSRGSDSVR